MIKKTALALLAAFTATAALADDAERQRLQALYDAVDSKDTAGPQSHVVFLPETSDQNILAAVIAQAAKDKFGAHITLEDINDRIFQHSALIPLSTEGRPIGVTADIHGPQGSEFACFAFMAPKLPDMKADMLASIGLKNYTGNNGIVYDGSSRDNPYEYSFNIPISPEAWHSYKKHLAAAQCLIDTENNPAFGGNRPDEKAQSAIHNAATGFAAIMAARDGYPEIMPFLADYIAATVHNPGNYQDYGVYALLVDPSIPTPRPQLGAAHSGGYQMNYPVELLDNLNKIWNRSNNIKNLPVADLYPAILQLAMQTAFDEKDMANLFDITQPELPPGHQWLDTKLQEKLLKRAERGAKNLNLCVSFSKTWEANGQKDGKDYWANRRQDIWTPPVCP